MHKLEQTICELYEFSETRYVHVVEHICSALGIGMRSTSGHDDTLPLLVESRIHDGDWVFQVDGNVFGEERQEKASLALRTLLSFAYPIIACNYNLHNGIQEVSVPIEVWGRSPHRPSAQELIRMGLIANLVLTHGKGERLQLSRIEIDARNIMKNIEPAIDFLPRG